MASPGVSKSDELYLAPNIAALKDKTDSAAEQYHKAQLHVSEARGKFYDRVTLLASGTIVLSFSFFATLVTKGGFVHIMLVLFVAWVSLLACILCCVFRNPPYHKYVLHAYAYYFSDAMKNQKEGELATLDHEERVYAGDNVNSNMPVARIKDQISLWDRKNQELGKKALQFHRHYRSLEQAALMLFLVGLFLLGVFTVKNVLANPHYLMR